MALKCPAGRTGDTSARLKVSRATSSVQDDGLALDVCQQLFPPSFNTLFSFWTLCIDLDYLPYRLLFLPASIASNYSSSAVSRTNQISKRHIQLQPSSISPTVLLPYFPFRGWFNLSQSGPILPFTPPPATPGLCALKVHGELPFLTFASTAPIQTYRRVITCHLLCAFDKHCNIDNTYEPGSKL